MEKFENAVILSIGKKELEGEYVAGTKTSIAFTVKTDSGTVEGWMRKASFMHQVFDLLNKEQSELLTMANIDEDVFTNTFLKDVFVGSVVTMTKEHYEANATILFGETPVTLPHEYDDWNICSVKIAKRGVSTLEDVVVDGRINYEFTRAIRRFEKAGIELDDAAKAKLLTDITRDVLTKHEEEKKNKK